LLLVRLQRRGPVSTVWRWTRRLAPRSALVARLEARAAAIDERLADYYRIERRAFLRATLWHFAAWLVGVLEVKLFMTLLGEPVSLRDALIVEALSQPIRALPLGPRGLPVSRLGLGLAALGRPGYITLGRANDLPAERTPAALYARSVELLDVARAEGVRYFDVARSYGRAEEFLARWLAER